MENFIEQLNQANSFNDIFKIVKKVVQIKLGEHRSGLSLILLELPSYMGAFHQIGSNSIVMNKTILNAMALLTKSKTEFNSYVFNILLHEYLHSLGHIREEEVRLLVREITEFAFGQDHIATKMAIHPLFKLYPELTYLGFKKSGELEIVKDFDMDNATYIK
ncbi:MAG: hypothetical protein QXF09_04790 [Nitrososphaerota archaeon]